MSPLFIRPARRSDCVDIARLVLMSSDGIAEYIWSPHVVGRTSLIAVGTQRCARDDVPFSYQNCLIAEQDGRIAGSLHAVPIAPDDDSAAADPDPVLRTLLGFSDRGSLEIRGLAVYPEFRGRGAATRLIAAAAARARTQGLARLSVIGFTGNEASLRFYAGAGFAETMRVPAPDHPSFRHPGGEMVRMTRSSQMTAAERAIADVPAPAVRPGATVLPFRAASASS